MLPIAATNFGYTVSQTSTTGARDYSAVIVDAVLKSFDSASKDLSSASIAVAAEFVRGVQPTAISGVTIKKWDPDPKLQVIKVDRLITLNLSEPLSAIIEPDADAFIVRCPDLPVFGFADDPIDAIASLKREIESLYFELMEDDNLSPHFLGYKEFLRGIIRENR